MKHARYLRRNLRGKPLVVLSNNDGCVVARSAEAKALGIKMGVPAFQIKEQIDRHGIEVFSSNYTLYADISHRVMSILGSLAPAIEIYSIDEAFIVWPYLLAPGGEIKGHYDGRLPVGLMDGSCIIESKATGGYSFALKKEEGADQGHVEQAFAYASRTGSPYFVIIYSNQEAKKSTPFYQVFAYRITNMKAADRAVLNLFAERFDPVLLSLHHENRPDAPMAPRHEFGARGWRCRPDKSYTRGKNNRASNSN